LTADRLVQQMNDAQRRRTMTMRRWILAGIALVAGALVLVVFLRDGDGTEAVQEAAHAVEAATERSGAGAGPAAPRYAPLEDVEDARIGEEDRLIFDSTMRRALDARLDTLVIGDRVVALGRWFVGAPYTPGTLETLPERLVVNLREFDCVTYVEAILAMARVLDGGTPTFERFLDELRRMRYRQGRIDGYASRLHYFSEWIRDNEDMGIVRDVTRELGGVATDEPIDFMWSNRDLYAALEDPEVLSRILAVEERLSARTRYYVPQEQIADATAGVRDGDVIAITSALEGLDIAHTGFALWIDGRLHFMNAPLVGKDVRISELPLAERVAGIEGQDGIMVARPLEVR
jgi:hypothetical protein